MSSWQLHQYGRILYSNLGTPRSDVRAPPLLARGKSRKSFQRRALLLLTAAVNLLAAFAVTGQLLASFFAQKVAGFGPFCGRKAAMAYVPTDYEGPAAGVAFDHPPEEAGIVLPDGVEHHTFRSASMDCDVGYNILLPPSCV